MDKLNGLRLRQLSKTEEMHLCAKDLIHDSSRKNKWDPQRSVVAFRKSHDQKPSQVS